jgi:GNAT superfamily N-acetyltransferase
VFRRALTGFPPEIVENSRIMLKIIKSMSQLNIDQFLLVYEESIRENAERFSMNQRQAENAFLDYLEEDFFGQKDAVYAVWVADDAYQCALRLERFQDGLLLEALETKPSARRKGYASALLFATLEWLKCGDYKVVYSHVNKRNASSLNTHIKCGFQICSDVATYVDGTVTQNSFTLRYKL